MSNLATCRGPLVERRRREHGVIVLLAQLVLGGALSTYITVRKVTGQSLEASTRRTVFWRTIPRGLVGSCVIRWHDLAGMAEGMDVTVLSTSLLHRLYWRRLRGTKVVVELCLRKPVSRLPFGPSGLPFGPSEFAFFLQWEPFCFYGLLFDGLGFCCGSFWHCR